MKYKTVIQITCDAYDKEDAINLAGEYLRGQVDAGVEMRCKAVSIKSQKIATFGLLVFIALFSLGICGVGTWTHDSSTQSYRFKMPGTYTVLPELKTKNASEFKKKWGEKKDEAILDYIKN